MDLVSQSGTPRSGAPIGQGRKTTVRKVIGAIGATLAMVVMATAAAVSAAGIGGAADRDRIEGDPRSQLPVFVLDKGSYTVFDAPGEGANELVDVSARGDVAGTYTTDLDETGSEFVSRGFLRDRRGRVTLFDYPGAEPVDPGPGRIRPRTFVNKVNKRGQVVGNAFVPARSDDEGRRAYLRHRDGRFTTIRVPGAVTTQALGLDDQGRVVGDYLDRKGLYHGYLWKRGRFSTIDVPRSTATTILGLNDRGEMVGNYLGADGTRHAFFRDRRGRITTIDARGVDYTWPLDLDDRGRVVGFTGNGSADDPNRIDVTTIHGFALKRGPEGPLSQIDVPGAPNTLASGIDDRGRIAGFYLNPNFTPSTGRTGAGAPMEAPL
jgi:hypothetical protein